MFRNVPTTTNDSNKVADDQETDSEFTEITSNPSDGKIKQLCFIPQVHNRKSFYYLHPSIWTRVKLIMDKVTNTVLKTAYIFSRANCKPNVTIISASQ